jgi:hypothetical protein
MKALTGESSSKLSESERTEIAAREATEALRDIATKHGLKPQDLSSRIAGGAAPVAPKEDAPPAAKDPAPSDVKQPEEAGEPEKPASAIEKEIEVKAEGPVVPPIPVEEASDEDLFGK